MFLGVSLVMNKHLWNPVFIIITLVLILVVRTVGKMFSIFCSLGTVIPKGTELRYYVKVEEKQKRLQVVRKV